MANTKSAIKAMRVAEKRRIRNRSLRSRMRTYVRRAQAAVAGKKEDTPEAVMEAIRIIDRTATKGVIHPNQAARRKSRLMKKLNAFQAAGS
ncbi:MAG: 30S ribosomal protein S20 [Chloroflexota bacterium]